jgi:hypothetical protein
MGTITGTGSANSSTGNLPVMVLTDVRKSLDGFDIDIDHAEFAFLVG